jgi:hypothetical protein
MAGQQIGQPEQQRAALQRRHRAPGVKRLAGAGHRPIRLPDIRRRYLGNRFAGGGVYHRQRRSVAGQSLSGNKLPVRLA